MRAGDLTPETVPVLEVERDGQIVILRGYVLGPRCLGSVKARVAGVSQEYSAATTRTVDATYDGPLDVNVSANGTRSVFVHDEAAWRAYHRDLLLAVIIGLEETEADTLSGETDRAEAPLRYLGWLPDTDAPEDEDADDDPEAVAVSSTTASYSPSSPPSTGSPQMSS